MENAAEVVLVESVVVEEATAVTVGFAAADCWACGVVDAPGW